MLKFFRQQPYKKVVLSDEEAWLLGFKEKDGIMQIPSGGTLHHFVKYRLGVKCAFLLRRKHSFHVVERRVDKIMEMVGGKIIKLTDSNDAKLDSTPLEASRYDQHSDFNPHYGCKTLITE